MTNAVLRSGAAAPFMSGMQRQTARHVTLANHIALLVGFLGCAILLWSGFAGLPAVAGIILVEQAICIHFGYARALRQAASGLPDFLAIFLTFVALLNTFSLIVLVSGFPEHDSFYYYKTPEAFLQVQLIYLIGILFFVLGWKALSQRERIGELPTVPDRISLPLMLALLFAWLALSAVSAAFAQRLASFALDLYLALIFLQLYSRGRLGIDGRLWWLNVVMILPPLLAAIPTGVKEQVINAVAPLVLVFILRPSVRRTAYVLIFTVVVILVVAPLSDIYRQANWFGGEDIGIAEGLDRLVTRYTSGGNTAVATDGLLKFSNRASPLGNGAIVYGATQDWGHTGLETVRNAPLVLIPRVVWPEKPVIAPGAWFTWHLGRADDPSEATTSTATPLAPEFYMMFGWPSVVVGMLLLGMYYALLWRVTLYLAGQYLIMKIAVVALLFQALKFHERHVIYAITGPISMLAYFLCAALLFSVFLRVRRHQVSGRLIFDWRSRL